MPHAKRSQKETHTAKETCNSCKETNGKHNTQRMSAKWAEYLHTRRAELPRDEPIHSQTPNCHFRGSTGARAEIGVGQHNFAFRRDVQLVKYLTSQFFNKFP